MEKLEDEVWRLKGGKGPRPREGVEVVPLWEQEEKISWWKKWWPGKVQVQVQGQGQEGEEVQRQEGAGAGAGAGVVKSGVTA